MRYVARMSFKGSKQKPEKEKLKGREAHEPRPRFAPAAFLSGSPEEVQQLCEELAEQAAARFAHLTGSSWARVGNALANQLREWGHDLVNFDESAEFQEWQATWHHPRGTFKLLLAFRAPNSVEVTWKADDVAYTARR